MKCRTSHEILQWMSSLKQVLFVYTLFTLFDVVGSIGHSENVHFIKIAVLCALFSLVPI